MATPPARLRSIVKYAQDAGWRYDETSKGHPRLLPPPGLNDPYRDGRPAAPVVFTKTTSEPRADQNAVAILRRLGVDIPRKGSAKNRN